MANTKSWKKALIYLVIFTIFHFLDDWLPFHFYILAKEESIFQHLKIAFISYLLFNLIIIKIKKLKTNEIYLHLLTPSILPWFIFLTWYLLPATFGNIDIPIAEIIFSMLTVYIAALFSGYIERDFSKSKISKGFRMAIISLLLISGFLYIRFTISLPWIDMFIYG